MPQPVQRTGPALVLAVLAHLLLIVALAFGVNWHDEEPTTIAADGWSKADARQFVWEQTQADTGGHGVTKFREPGNVKIVVAGGTAGRFSAWIPGWPFPDSPSSLVLKRIADSG